MEQNSNDLFKLANLPSEIQQHIAGYLDASALRFFALSDKQRLKNILPLLVNYQAMFPLRLTTNGSSTYLTQAHQLFVCGNNESGQLGLDNSEPPSTFTTVPWPEERGRIEQVIAGQEFIVVLTSGNKLLVCGSNHLGQLGLDDNEPRSTFTTVPWPEERGRIEQVIAGAGHTLVLTQDNRLWVCGYNQWGQLGLDDTANRPIFTTVPWSEEQGKIERVIAGGGYTVVLTQDNRLWGCGYNRYGQLGLDDTADRSTFTAIPWPDEQGKIEQVIAGGYHTLVLTEGNQLWGCGSNHLGQLGLGNEAYRSIFTAMPWPEEQGKIEQVIAGGTHTLVLTDDHRLWVCGHNNDYGQLGLGDKVNRFTFTTVPWPKERGRIEQVIAGAVHTLVLSQDNRLWGCGDNGLGQLGLGDNNNRSTFTPVNMKKLSPALQEVFTLNNHLNQLIKIGTSLTQTSGTETGSFHNQHQLDEPAGQLPLKKR